MAGAPDAGSPSAPVFTYQRRVAFAETDQAGIVHFSVYFRYMEEAEHAWWREAGLSIAPAGAEHGFPRVSATFDYRLPLRFEDVFEVRLRVERASTRTLRYRAELWRGADHVGTGGMVMVCVRTGENGAMKATAIPAHVWLALGLQPD